MKESPRILVCDDDESILEVIKIILETDGCVVKALTTGRGIRQKILDYKPDLIFLDIWMPGIDGEEIVKILKRDSQTNQIPIIIVSALNNLDRVGKTIGADDVLEKPFDMGKLLMFVKKYALKKTLKELPQQALE